MKKQTKLGLVLAAAAVISVSVASLVSARGWVQNGADWYYVDNGGEYVTETIQSSGNAKFYLGEDGTMQRDYFLEDYNGNAYYFGQNGAMVTNTWVAIESSRVENQDEYVPDNYWYYFQASGKAMKASAGNLKRTTIDGKKYGFNEYGQMVTGWVTSDGKTNSPDENSNPFEGALYYAGGDNDGVLRAGWVTYYDGYDTDTYESEYSNLYFYFNTSNNQMYKGTTKKINGRTYAFNSEGVMLSGWDVYDYNSDILGGTTYFSGQDDGHQVKKGWVYAVPAEDIDKKAYDEDEEKYMYFNASGEIVRDQFKKVNGKYYVFDRGGIMKTGLVIWAPDGVEHLDSITKGDGTAANPDIYNYSDYRFIGTFELDWATGEELSKKGIVRYGDETNEYFYVNTEGVVIGGWNFEAAQTSAYAPTTDGQGHPGYTAVVAGNNVFVNTGKSDISLGTQLKWHNFGSDGARKTGVNNVEFADEVYGVNTTSSGDKGSGIFAKKYYSLGVQLKASADIRYGIYNIATVANTGRHAYGEPLAPQAYKNANRDVIDTAYRDNLVNGYYLVLNTGGSKQKGQTTSKKDADGNYWLIDKGSDTLKGIWSVNVKQDASFGTSLKTRAVRLSDKDINQLIRWGVLLQTDENSQITLGVASISQLDDGDKYMALDASPNGELSNWVWYARRSSKSSKSVWFAMASTNARGYGYQSDINDQSNKWIPFGVLDNSNKSVRLDVNNDQVNNQTDKRFNAYEVVPNNDYFLNCYWISIG